MSIIQDNKPILVLATRNPGKITEFSSILAGYPIVIKNLDDFGPIPEVVENGANFDENAYLKSSFVSRVLGFPALADDSGLVVEALNGAPGVYSARYAGEHATDAERCQKLLAEMKGKENRKAAFVCVISLATPSGAALTYEARCEGIIADAPQGQDGFGYDPIFFYPPLAKTFAQIAPEEKNRISHRGQALHELKNEFEKVLKWIDFQTPTTAREGCSQ